MKTYGQDEYIGLDQDVLKTSSEDVEPTKVSSIKTLINKCNWDGIKYPSKIDDWKTFETNNPTIAFNVLYTKEIEICPA